MAFCICSMRAECLVNHVVVVVKDEREQGFSLGGVKEGGVGPLGLVKHLPLVEVKVVAELIVELPARQEQAIGMAHAQNTMHSKFVEALVSNQLVDGGEGLEEHH